MLTIQNALNFPEIDRIDKEALLQFVLKKDRSFLFAHPEYILTREEERKFNLLLERRIKGEPIAYIIEKKGFWKHEFYVTADVLIPRPETELLIELILKQFCDRKNLSLIDVGTGSGAIAVSLQHEKPDWFVVATDISLKALQVAKKNQQKILVQGDALTMFEKNSFDIVVSNPPYIDPSDPALNQGDLRFEPKHALSAEKNGLEIIEKIITQAKAALKNSGWIFLEHGYQQGSLVRILLENNGFQSVITYRDFQNHERISCGKAHNS